jgi:hypothetical protein
MGAPGIRYYGRRRRQIIAFCKNRHTQESGRRIGSRQYGGAGETSSQSLKLLIQ